MCIYELTCDGWNDPDGAANKYLAHERGIGHVRFTGNRSKRYYGDGQDREVSGLNRPLTYPAIEVTCRTRCDGTFIGNCIDPRYRIVQRIDEFWYAWSV